VQERFSFDAAYVQRLKEGDPATERHFAEYFGELIQIKAATRLRSASGADDIRQETLFRVLRNVRQGALDHPERLGAYVNTVSNHVIQETFRRNRRTSEFPKEGANIASGEASAEFGLLENERAEMVRRALGGLASEDRELLQRVFLEDEDKDAVCRDLGVSREYLRVLLHRARSRLRIALTR